MNNQNNQNSLGDHFDSRKNSSLPEEIRFFGDSDSAAPSGQPPKKGRSPITNRVLYVTAVALLLSVAIIAAITSAANRSRKNPTETPSNSTVSSTQKNPDSQSPESTPNSTPTPDESVNAPTEDVVSKLPDFKLPVAGTLAVSHDPDLQVFSPTMQEYRVHMGVDINTTEGAPVYAAAKGKVTKVWNDPMMGWCIEISHDGNAATYYKNLDETLAEGIKEGITVSSGQLIGAVGDSAVMEVAQEPHLHFEITVNGKMEDPLEFFARDVLAELESDESYEG